MHILPSQKLHVAIPLGVGAPGTPVPALLRNSLQSLKSQTIPVEINVVCDNNVSDEIKGILKEFEVNVDWYEPFFYFRPGGIWKKIFDSWKKTNCKYVAFLHYDDLWDVNKAEKQVALLEKENLLGCWCESYVINSAGAITSSDCIQPKQFTVNSVGSPLGLAFCHSLVLEKHAILNSGILAHEEKWASEFERILSVYTAKLFRVKKCEGAKVFWRSHELNVSHTLFEDKSFTQDQRNTTGYTLQKTLDDATEVKIDLEPIRALYR